MKGPEHLAIDPGDQESGWVRFRLAPKKPGGIEILAAGITENRTLRLAMKDMPKPLRGTLSIEMPKAQGMAVANEVFATCVEIGRFLQTWGGLNWSYIFRGHVKLAICGAPNAKDPNVRMALIDEFGGEKEAIGGKKCPKCKGKCWIGRDHDPCEACEDSPGWQYPPGPLKEFHDDMWAALAVAITWAKEQPKTHFLSASNKTSKRKKLRT
jgi:hypothetical protein